VASWLPTWLTVSKSLYFKSLVHPTLLLCLWTSRWFEKSRTSLCASRAPVCLRSLKISSSLTVLHVCILCTSTANILRKVCYIVICHTVFLPLSSSSKFITPGGTKPKGLHTLSAFHCTQCGHDLDSKGKAVPAAKTPLAHT
jgi:hypothetical protein